MAEISRAQNLQIGIVLATYNCDRAHFAAQINSIQQQDFPQWRCLIADDGSKPDIQTEIRQAIADDERFIYHAQTQNLGSYHNFEYGLNYFRQDDRITHIAFADQDDIWQAHKLTHLITAMTSKGAVLAHSDLSLIDAKGQQIHPSVWQYEKRQPEQLDPALLLLRNTVTGCTVLIDRCLLAKALPFPPQSQSGDWYHDHWLALMAAQTGKIVHLREPLVQYRQHSHNVVGAEKKAGTIRKELELWLAKKGRLTLQSYRIHRDLSAAFFQRFYPLAERARLNPFSEHRFDFGLAILKLGCRSFFRGYGSQGITLRLWVNKFIFDSRRLRKKLLTLLFGQSAQ